MQGVGGKLAFLEEVLAGDVHPGRLLEAGVAGGS